MSEADEGVQPDAINPPDTQLLDRRIDAALSKRQLSDEASGGGGPGGGDMVARLAKVEASVAHIESSVSDIKQELRTLRENARGDFRLVFGAIIAVALGLAGLVAKGFHWIG